ncbi:excalibur calcium-binding domain-containing protein [Oharaeibacter diazotrophicus]|uniref:Excalibur calcium-binding domain-containing protein n=1 Tax=Oharaeibacter diazotrophicus TaxID=1920512 RepID=A0A4R6RCX6_9HYPH|nr:excalibur calcium-binding domain-containing protein [Oharaeibacter diazotrophicus]TDP83934.1 excalibur calcium-binding domain-containing protein [Oharaeibacter diazotrophicus]BBE72975.1 excalibur calcium-binding domain protein [Pleomorphomonas sp. SM30]GLS74764.1 hypothetical protein GCM10007904_00990 [Oharaeibacter diazotrophicus]
MRTPILTLALVAVICPVAASAHPGGLNAQGCHNDRKRGGYHCHRTQAAPEPSSRLLDLVGGGEGAVSFPSCKAARAAGYSRMRIGQPGYSPKLDRDGDGIACE